MNKTTAYSTPSVEPSKAVVPSKKANVATKPKPTVATTPAVLGAQPAAQPSTSSRKRPPADVAPEESLDEVTVKRSRSSGTLLKDLLQQGCKILYMAANKVHQFAPATISSSDALERMDTLEKLLKEHREEVNAKLDAVSELGLEIQQITPMLKLMTEKMVLIDGKVQKTATSSEVAEGNLAQGIRLHHIENDIRKLQEWIHLPEVQKLTFDLNLLHKRLDAIERRLSPPQTVHAAEAHT
ncbi:unnamed protein product [Heligmosomoides polygyrus]|uniref:BLOC-1-related complex subunit 5 n=1 Tax=Heligmosomoides polygyrus TaxID=6339 RepID=A0A183GAR3_HELPZ|nr:unnamed protein product [Heligmosomoides polygyrus]